MVRHPNKTYGLLGYPLGHSFSQTYFNKKFQAEGIDAEYINFEIPSIDELPSIIATHPAISGLNVTIPYKEQVIPHLNELDPKAAKIGAVNVIKIIRDEKGRITALKGYNSDVIGFTDSLRPLLTTTHTKALVLGTGGAAKAIVQGLKDLGIAPTLVSRKPGEGRLTYADLTPQVMADHKVIVNTTPLGMYPHIEACPNIPYDLLTPEHLCYDLIYNPDTTEFLKRSAAHGAVTKNGLEMLLLQAFASWTIWNL